ncbi:MAG: hypothetical protein V5789_01760 [Colwellia sp.]
MLEQHDRRKITKPVNTSVVITETPFDKRHFCWFCGEPSHVDFIFPPNTIINSYHEKKYLLLSCPHPTISVPCCGECQKLAGFAEVSNIWAVNAFVKKKLLKRYAKDLAIGVNWTQQELANSEFEHGSFSGFAKSAWFIYEVAKGRVNYSGWPLVADGLELEAHEVELVAPFYFDGVMYPSIANAIEHYGNIFLLDPHYVSAVLQHMANGRIDEQSFAQAVRFCRLLVNATMNERKVAFNGLMAQSD